jgi:SAM-dependent methyltransferase
MSASERTTATTEGSAWSAAAHGWAAHWAAFGAPAREAVALAAGIEADTSLLDLGCGSGEFCARAAAYGARVCGIDAAEGLVEIARQRVPNADLRVGAIERLPWPDDSFDVVTGFNVFQFAADFVAALAEARRVTRRGGRVAICNWGRAEDCEVHAISELLADRKSSVPREAPVVGEPGVLEELARRAGLNPKRAEELAVPYEFPDRSTLERALFAIAPVYEVGPEAAERVVRQTVEGPAERFRRSDGSYRFDNRWRYLIAVA